MPTQSSLLGYILGYLARIVMFDQGSRTAFRGTPKAFAFDEAAAKLTLSIVQKGWLVEKFLPIERQAILTPLLHSEHLPDHDAAVSLIPLICEGLEDEAAVACFAGTPPFFEEHREVVRKFGRFPSRNGALVRKQPLIFKFLCGICLLYLFIYFISFFSF